MAENHSGTEGFCVIELEAPRFCREEEGKKVLLSWVMQMKEVLNHIWEGAMKQCEKGLGLF